MAQKLIFDVSSYTLSQEEQEEIAFWNYDQYPYTLYGTVVSQNGEYITTKQYGSYKFKAKKIFPRSEASVVIEELDHLKLDRQKALGLIEKEYRIKLAELSERFDIPMPVHVFK